jgi:hypothetical protein
LTWKSICGLYDLADTMGYLHPEDGDSKTFRRGIEVCLALLREKQIIPDYPDQLAAYEAIRKKYKPQRYLQVDMSLEELQAIHDGAKDEIGVLEEQYQGAGPDVEERIEAAVRSVADTAIGERIQGVAGMTGPSEEIPSSSVVAGGDVVQPPRPSTPPWEGLGAPNAEAAADFLTSRNGAKSELALMMSRAVEERNDLLRRAVEATMWQLPPDNWASLAAADIARQYYKTFEGWKGGD